VNQFLFGNLSTVSEDSAAILLALFVIVIGVVGLTRNQLLYVTFDETAAAVSGLSVSWYNRTMVMLTAMVVVGAMQSQVARSFTESLLVSVVLAELAVILGIGVSYYGKATAGGVIVLVAVTIYVIAVVLGKLQTAFGEEGSPEMGRIDINKTESSGD
jgi:zinc transport system permease protein